MNAYAITSTRLVRKCLGLSTLDVWSVASTQREQTRGGRISLRCPTKQARLGSHWHLAREPKNPRHEDSLKGLAAGVATHHMHMDDTLQRGRYRSIAVIFSFSF